jgi:oxygen-dependent protoporphyrinogen oxidase
MGQELLDHLVEPLIGGIHAGRADRLSLAAVVPQLSVAVQRDRSLILGLRHQKQRQSTPIRSTVPPLLTFEKGLNFLIEHLRQALSTVDIRLGTALQTIQRKENGQFLLTCATGEAFGASCVVLTTPAYAAAEIIEGDLPAIATELRQIEHASVMVTHLAYRPDALPVGRLQGSGFLVPRADGRLMNACTCVNYKWPRQRDSDLIIFRCSAGRAGDERAAGMSDTQLVASLHQELSEALGLTEPPIQRQITRWPRAFPQYVVGHQARIKGMETTLSEQAPGLLLAGAPYHGLGLASCLKDGVQVAERVLGSLQE